MLGSAQKLVVIESNTVYEVPDKSKDCPIYSIHCLESNTTDVTIVTWFDNKEIVFPKGAFVAGAIYPIYVKRMTFDTGKFVGYKLAKTPTGLKF